MYVRKARSTGTANCPVIFLERMQLSLPEDVFLNIASRLQSIRRRTYAPWEAVTVSGGNPAVTTPCGRFSLGGDGLPGVYVKILPRVPKRLIRFKTVVDAVFGWRDLYIKRHNEVADVVRPLVHSVEESLCTSQSLDISLYWKIFEELKSLELSFIDVKMLMFKTKFNELLHLVSLHYCCIYLQVPVKDMVKAVVDSKISEGQVCVQWVPRGRLFHGFGLTDEPRSLLASLNEIASSHGHGILRILNRGAVHKVMRVQTSLSNSTPCRCCQLNTGSNQDHNVPQGSKFT